MGAGVSFTVNSGEIVGLDGVNGCGKSSILKLLAGCGIEHTGELHISSGLKISYVPQDTSGICGTLYDIAEESAIDQSLFLSILRKMDFERESFEGDVKNFSCGQKKKVLIAKSLCESAHLYIWDEPLNFIDIYSRMQIERLITEFKPTMLLVEHDRAFRDAVMTKVVKIG